MRTLVDIPEEDIRRLDELAAARNQSRAAAVREAVRLYLVGNSDQGWIAKGAGYWRDRDDIDDAVEYQRAMRADRTFD